MQKYIFNCQSLISSDLIVVDKPYETVQWDKKSVKIACIENPYIFFDRMLKEWIDNETSHLFFKDMKRNIVKMEPEAFLIWLDTLNIIPLYNPQTFKLDLKKRIDVASENLETFDYVVPAEEKVSFLNTVFPNVVLTEENDDSFYFKIKTYAKTEIVQKFLNKDVILHENAQILWEKIKMHEYAPLGTFLESGKKDFFVNTKNNKYRGMVGIISQKTIGGWVVKEGSPESLAIEIYKNGENIHQMQANKMRIDIKEKGIHPTGECGFRIEFEEEIFCSNDSIEVRVSSGGFLLTQGQKAKEFLKQ